MFRHIVGVNLKYEKDDPRVKEFFKAAGETLAKVPQVKRYAHYLVDNPEECGYQYGFVLDFETKEAWMEYNEHPNSVKFTDEYWNDGTSNYFVMNFTPFDER